MRILMVLFLLVVMAAFSGCSFSKSSESISDSISSPSKSSSKSSDGGDDSGAPEAPQDAAAYQGDVAQIAATYAQTGGDIGALRSAVTKLASQRGITNWETDPKTCEAIGRGVGTGGMGSQAFGEFSKDLFGDDLTKATELRKGYQATAPAEAEPAKATALTESEGGA